MSNTWYGFNMPFIGGNQNVMSQQSGDRLVKNDILQLLLTSTGERVRRLSFGTILRKSLFEGVTDNLIDEIRYDIINKIERFDTRLSVSKLDINNDNNKITIDMTCKYSNSPDTIDFNIVL